MPSLRGRLWRVSPSRACSPAEMCAWETARPAGSLLERMLEDGDAQLGALERDALLLLDGTDLRAWGQASAPRRESSGRLSLDLAGFSPEDVAVRLDGRRLKVTAKRQTQKRAPDGCCARDYREVSREVLLPEDADLEAVTCALHAHGQLRVEVPRLPPERVVPIHREAAVEQGTRVEGGEEAPVEERRRLQEEK